MKVIKRDGRAVDYDRQKIITAINKANLEVPENEKASLTDIKKIIAYIESLEKKRMLVEDIQDIIEQKLMELQKFSLAKKYIVYRYTRALVRKQNTTDESILGMIRSDTKEFKENGKNQNTYLASVQRDLIASEVSEDLTKRLLLPEKITKADEEGLLHFHHAQYFIQPIFYSSFICMKDMLSNGTVINGILIEPPKSFSVACTVFTQIIAAIASNQYGGQSIDISCLGEYVQKSYEKIKKHLQEKYASKMEKSLIEEMTNDMLQTEIANGVQTILYQINTLMTANGNTPSVTFFLHLNEKTDTYIKENALIMKELFKQRVKGIKNEQEEYVITEFPKLVYVLDENNHLAGGKFDDITKCALECSLHHVPIYYLSAKIMKENYAGNVFSPCGSEHFLSLWKNEKGNYQFEGRFHQGLVTINLVQIALATDGNEEKFWEELDKRLDICKEALLYKHYTLLNTLSNISPIHWQHGGIVRLPQNEKVDKFLKNGYSTLLLGYMGVSETTQFLKGYSMLEKEGQIFALQLIQKIQEKVEKWKQETGIGFALCSTNSPQLSKVFVKKDKEKYGTIKGITDQESYQNTFLVDMDEQENWKEKLAFVSKLQNLSLGGCVLHLPISSQEEAEEAILWLYEHIQYVQLN